MTAILEAEETTSQMWCCIWSTDPNNSCHGLPQSVDSYTLRQHICLLHFGLLSLLALPYGHSSPIRDDSKHQKRHRVDCYHTSTAFIDSCWNMPDLDGYLNHPRLISKYRAVCVVCIFNILQRKVLRLWRLLDNKRERRQRIPHEKRKRTSWKDRFCEKDPRDTFWCAAEFCNGPMVLRYRCVLVLYCRMW